MSKIFSVLVLTAPTERIAAVYLLQLQDLMSSLPCLAACKHVYCVSDPEGERIGSGGGTLHALSYVQSQLGVEETMNQRILMVHSGGDSRRVPTCSVIGKAWSSLNSLLSETSIASPLGLLVTELSGFCGELPLGSLVVASSDVLLDIWDKKVKIAFHSDAVTLVAVPEIPEVAKNHGVVIVDRNHEMRDEITSTLPAMQYQQKPSIDDMTKSRAICYDKYHTLSEYVWIDTGVVVFCGQALHALLGLLIQPPFDAAYGGGAAVRPSVTGTRLRVELYSEILLACSVKSERRDLDSYLNSLNLIASDEVSEYNAALYLILDSFANIPLVAACVQGGIFAHLGTTAEFKSLLLTVPDKAREDGIDMDVHVESKHDRLARQYHLTPSVLCLGSTAQNVVCIGSCVGPKGEVRSESLVEYSLLSGEYLVGSDCVVSNVRKDFGFDLKVQDGMILQQVPLQLQTLYTEIGSRQTLEVKPYILSLLAIRDDVKAHYEHPDATICGNSWGTISSVL